MDFIASPLGVMLILVMVAVAAFQFAPDGPSGKWAQMGEWFGTNVKPLDIAFTNEPIEVQGLALFDANLDDEGLWLQYSGPQPAKAPESMLIPWRCILVDGEKGGACRFQLADGRPLADGEKRKLRIVKMTTRQELGHAIRRRVERYRAEQE